jgi:small subunit ribosomal protein S11
MRSRSLLSPYQKFSPFLRPFSNTPQKREDRTPQDSSTPPSTPQDGGSAAQSLASMINVTSKADLDTSASKGLDLGSLSRLFSKNQASRKPSSTSPSSSETNTFNYDISALNPGNRLQVNEPPHHLHIYSHKHNTHITLTRPNRDPIISVSTGNIGFRKAARSTYNAAYQLAAYVLGRIQEQGLLGQIKELEVVLRGFGVGRDACTKALLGSEGRFLRTRVVRVTDATRLKFGGTRSKKPRRLG